MSLLQFLLNAFVTKRLPFKTGGRDYDVEVRFYMSQEEADAITNDKRVNLGISHAFSYGQADGIFANGNDYRIVRRQLGIDRVVIAVFKAEEYKNRGVDRTKTFYIDNSGREVSQSGKDSRTVSMFCGNAPEAEEMLSSPIVKSTLQRMITEDAEWVGFMYKGQYFKMIRDLDDFVYALNFGRKTQFRIVEA